MAGLTLAEEWMEEGCGEVMEEWKRGRREGDFSWYVKMNKN